MFAQSGDVVSDKRHAANMDKNQPGIVAALRKMGYSVELNHNDIVVGIRGASYWYEIKDPSKAIKKDGTWRKGALRPSQVRLQAEFRGHYEIVTTLEQILADIKKNELRVLDALIFDR